MGSRSLDEMEEPIEEWEIIRFIISYKAKDNTEGVFEVEHSIYGSFEAILMMEIEELYCSKDVKEILDIEILRKIWVIDNREINLAKEIIKKNASAICKFLTKKEDQKLFAENEEKQTLLNLLEKYKESGDIKEKLECLKNMQ